MAKTTLTSQPVPTSNKPTGVDTSGPKVTPELQKTMVTTNLGSQPVIQPTAQEISKKSEDTANANNAQQQAEANQLIAQGDKIDQYLHMGNYTDKTTDTSGTGEYKAFDPNNKTIWQGGSNFGVPGESGTTTQTGQPAPTTAEKTTETTTPTTDITYKEDKKPYTPEKVIGKAEAFQGQDGKQYQTVRNSDNTLTTIDTQTGQPVTGKYTDAEREQIKQSLVGTTVKPTVDDYYNKIQSGGTIPQNEKSTTEYRQAENRKVNLDKFSSMSSSDLAYAIEKGQFLPGTQVYNDLKAQNPKLVADAEALNSINSKNSSEKPNPDSMLQSISDYLTKLMTQEEKVNYAGKISENKDIIELNNSLGETAKQMADIKDELEYSLEDLRKDFGGKTVTKGYLASKNSERTRELGRQYNLLLAEYNTTAGQIQTISEGIKYEIQQEQQQKQTNLQNFQTGFNMYQSLTANERSLELQKQSQLLQTGDLNSTDPYIQQRGIENAVNQLYSQYPIPGMESPAIKIQKVKDLVTQGMTPQQAISQLEQEIRGSQRYKDDLANEKAKITPKATESWQKLSDNSLYNQTTGEVKNVGGTGMTANVSVQTDPQSIVDFCISRRGRDSVQCGELVNDYIFKITGTDPQGDLRFENTLADKNKAIETIGESTVPVVGGLFTLDVGTTAGHTGIVQSVDGNQITVLEANRESKSEGQPPVISTYTINDKMRFSQAPKSTTNLYENLDKTQQSRIDKYVLDFENQPEVKEYSVIKSQLEGAREYAKKDGSNTDDQALIYTFAKVMDPNSVVRESEYGTVQEYSQDLLGRYAGKISRIYSTDGFLTQDAKDKMLKTLETKLKASESIMSNIRKATAKQLNQITGQQNGEEFLKDFVGQSQPIQVAQPTTTQGRVKNSGGRIK